MAQDFLSCDRDQQMLLPADLREWLAEDHLAWFVLDAVKEMNLEPRLASAPHGGSKSAWSRTSPSG
ncbi:MAG: hypothetical protein ABW065_14825 [Solirubrobacterales bacterium]